MLQLDNPHVRSSDLCPLCDGLKPVGTVACWSCYRNSKLKYGNATAEAMIARRELALATEAA